MLSEQKGNNNTNGIVQFKAKNIKMSHRSRRSDDRDRDRSSYKYDKHDRYEHRHRRDYDDDYYDDSRDHRSDYYSSRSRHRSRSRSSSKSYSRHHRSRSRSSGHSYSRHHNDYHSRSHRSKDYRDSPESKSHRDLRDYHQSKHGTVGSDSKADKKCNEINETDGPTSISTDQQNSKIYNTGTNDEPKINSSALNEQQQDPELEEEKQRIQRETMERLQKHFEKEGKAYPPPKPQASHPIFKNDGSFLEIFKKTIQQQQTTTPSTSPLSPSSINATAATAAAKEPLIKPAIAAAATTTNPVVPILPVKRRGAKILKTGIVQKKRIIEEAEEPQSTDSWSTYLKEVKRYKTVTCSDDNITRSLVK